MFDKNYTPLPERIKTNENKTNPAEIMEGTVTNPASIDNNQLQYIRDKKKYKTFLKLIKKNKFTTAILAAEICGTTRQTIGKWLETPLAIKVMNSTLDNYISKVEGSKDWKAQAWLVDKLHKKDDITNIQVNMLDGLTIVRK